VEGSRQDALPRAVLAPQEHRHIVVRRPRDDLQHRLHARRRGLEPSLGCRFLEARLQLAEAERQRASLACAVDQVPDLRGRERLRQVILGPAAHRLDRGVDRGVGGDDDHVEARPLAEEPRQEVESALGPQLEVAEGEVERLPPQDVERGRPGGHLLHLAAETFEADRERLADVPLIVDDEDVQR
jgi:hypothetical protein